MNAELIESAFAGATVGLVVIGRNEGQRLVKCLASIDTNNMPVIYVDSGSSDNSQQAARDAGCHVVELDLSIPFTAGRARNAGFKQLLHSHPRLEYVQFLDGDCQLDPQWISQAQSHLATHAKDAIACGRRREIYPDRSIYNRLCDVEWNTPVGQADACGGDFLIRVSAFREVSGFSPDVIAGEEPEMCFRLRRAGWHIARVEAEMTLHDAAMDSFSQYGRRSERSGHAYAQAAAMHGGSAERFQVRQLLGILFWGLAYPALTVIFLIIISPMALGLLLAYPLLWMKITAANVRNTNLPRTISAIYAAFLIAAKFYQAYGALKYFNRRVFDKDLRIIEYK